MARSQASRCFAVAVLLQLAACAVADSCTGLVDEPLCSELKKLDCTEGPVQTFARDKCRRLCADCTTAPPSTTTVTATTATTTTPTTTTTKTTRLPSECRVYFACSRGARLRAQRCTDDDCDAFAIPCENFGSACDSQVRAFPGGERVGARDVCVGERGGREGGGGEREKVAHVVVPHKRGRGRGRSVQAVPPPPPPHPPTAGAVGAII